MARLRNETRVLHTGLERGPFMAAMLRGQLDLRAYCLYLRNLQAIYAALEDAMVRHAADPLVAPVYMPALFRCAALEQDLNALHGPTWACALPLQPACYHYVERLQAVLAGDALLLVAHAYVRYLGDLSGGQMLKRIVAGSLQLEGGVGTAFYDFGDSRQVAALTFAFRDGLCQVSTDKEQIGRIVAEALEAFELHRLLFQQLDLARHLPCAPPLIA